MLGNSRQSENELIILKIRTTDDLKSPTPVHFEVSKKVGDKWSAVAETKEVSGTITKVETYEREWEGVVTPLVKVYLEDAEAKESYLLDLRYNMLSRNLFNTLLSLESFDGVKIGVYERKKGDKTYPAVSVRQNDQLVNWKYKIEELPAIEKVQVGKKEITNFDNLNDFFIEELKGLGERVKGGQKAAPVTKTKRASQPSESPLSDDSEIPF